jgi:tryptophan 2,3-dioxygenase
VAEATRVLECGELVVAVRLLGRAALCLGFVTDQLAMLEQLSPCDFGEIRKVLGHGSGFDSPGFRELRRLMARLGTAFARTCERAGVELVEVYVHARDHEQLYTLAEALLTLDERLQTWRLRHYKVVARTIGNRVMGIQGTPVEALAQLISKVAYPELWDVRNALTARSQAAASTPAL